jgi:hypothetical protein
MITDEPEFFMFIEPIGGPTAPIDDDVTHKARELYASTKTGKSRYRGIHFCTWNGCDATSDNTDHYLPDGRCTHSLLVHYVSQHRDVGQLPLALPLETTPSRALTFCAGEDGVVRILAVSL